MNSVAPGKPVGRLVAAVACAISLFSGCQPGTESAPVVADQIFTGRFLTFDDARPEVDAIAVQNGLILATGDIANIMRHAGNETDIVDIGGVGVPGWVDAHVHITMFGQLLESLNVQSMTRERIVAAVAAAAESAEPGEWIIGRGWDEGFFAVAAYPNAADLDAVSPDNPVILNRIGGHSAWVNSRALSLAGIDAETADPVGGRIVRDVDGAATGMLLEQAESLVRKVMPDLGSNVYRERFARAALAQYARWGLTGVHDAGTTMEDLAVLKRLDAQGELPLRVYSMVMGDAAVLHYLQSGPELAEGDSRLTVRSFKIYVDGALGARGAEMSSPYSDAPETSGLQQMSDAELDSFIGDAVKAGMQVNGHVIGDLGVQRLLDAVERNKVPPEERFRIEHASLISPPNLPRFAALGVIASMQPVFIGEYQRWGVDRVGPERASWIMPIGDLVKSGAHFVASTDYPASDSGDPRTTLSALVTRTGFDGKPPGGFFPEQAVDVDTALASMSIAAAYASFSDDRVGPLVPGMLADFTVLSQDPRKIAPAGLLTIGIEMAVVGGVVTFDRSTGGVAP